jgi:DNA-binding NarL/FixJ family response regulator
MSTEAVPPPLSRYRTVVVADPFPLSRNALAALLRRSGSADVVVEVGDAGAALRGIRERRTDLLVTNPDLTAPGDGIALCEQVKALARPVSVLVFSASSDPGLMARCMIAGADGFVHRSADARQLLHSVELLAAGRGAWFLGPDRGDRPPQALLQAYEPQLDVRLTAREQEVLGLLLARRSNDEIAAELHLARQTVKNHVSNVLGKLGVANRRELLAMS